MRLTQFIEQNEEQILVEWVRFATGHIPAAKGRSDESLRDHAKELLAAVVEDMGEPQSDQAQSDKSQGHKARGVLGAVGQKHGIQRLASGFDLEELVSEYRALRASVLRLWAETQGDEHREVTRFNEAIDESLTASLVRFSSDLDVTREQFLAMIGHDLRNPLGAIIMGTTVLSSAASLQEHEVRCVARVLSSAQHMTRMVGELLDFTRARLGTGIPITRTPSDLGPVCEQVVAELQSIHADREIRFERRGTLLGDWDASRLTQLLSNLVGNALQHGRAGSPVSVLAEARDERVVVEVHNEGEPIPARIRKTIFEPMVRHPSGDGRPDETGLGLGLYIAHAIAAAHDGTIEVSSTAPEGTTFTVELPRSAPQAAAP